MRQHDRNRVTPVEPEDSVWSILPISLIVVLCVGILTMSVLKSFTFGPSVGDVIVFQPPATPVSNDGMQRNELSATIVDGSDRHTCSLNPATMLNEGGSMLVEQSATTGRALMRVHWAGHHTNKGAGDCGASADLLIARNDLLDLAGAAGGFGFTHKMVISNQVAGNPPALLD